MVGVIMQNEFFEQMERINYWHNPPQNIRFIRHKYVETAIGYLGNNLVKVLVGQRRCGKSTILKQVIHYLLEHKTLKKNIRRGTQILPQ